MNIKTISAEEESIITPIEISPHQVTFKKITVNDNSGTIPNSFSQQYLFRITNRTDRDVYGIGAKLAIKSEHLSISDFNLDIPKSGWVSLNNSGRNEIQLGDMIALGCHNKETNRYFFVVEIERLKPRESREIAIWESTFGNDIKDAATITGTVFHSTFEPSPLLRSDKGSISLPNIPFPETATIEKIITLTLPKQP